MSNFSLDVSKFVDKATKNAEAKIRAVCLELYSGISYLTPVDTGRAKNNWFTSIGSASTETTTATDPTGAQGIARSQADIKAAPGNIFYISNNLPYISKLEFGGYPPGPKIVNGYSSQAPRGMVRVTIDRIQRELR